MRVPMASLFLLLRLLLVVVQQPYYCVVARQHPKVKLILLVGDDNIEGFASIGHLHQLVEDPDTTKQFQHLIDPTTGTWRERDDVFVTYDHHRDKDFLYGPLSLQFGGDLNGFGPELQMGHVLGDHYKEPVVIIKAGWKQRTLDIDFASPSTNHTGYQWHRLITSIQNTATLMHEILGPEYRYSKPNIGGLLWWHGYSDFADEKKYRAYANNLKYFLTDVRIALKQPNMPIVVAELGGQGSNTTDLKELDFRSMQERVIAQHFSATPTRFVLTAPYVETETKIKDYTMYYGSAKTMVEISQAFAIAIIDMDTTSSATSAGRSNDRKVSFFQIIFFLGVCLVGAVMFVWFNNDVQHFWDMIVNCLEKMRIRAPVRKYAFEAVNTDDSEHDHLGFSERSVPDLQDT